MSSIRYIMEEAFDYLPRPRRKQPDREQPRRFPKRLKNEGSETANMYNQLALDTIGEEMWKQMKMGRLNWASIEDEHFAIAERLGQQLETYDPNEVVENTVSVPVVVEPQALVEPQVVDSQTKKPKKKRDRRIKTKLQDSTI